MNARCDKCFHEVARVARFCPQCGAMMNAVGHRALTVPPSDKNPDVEKLKVRKALADAKAAELRLRKLKMHGKPTRGGCGCLVLFILIALAFLAYRANS